MSTRTGKKHGAHLSSPSAVNKKLGSCSGGIRACPENNRFWPSYSNSPQSTRALAIAAGGCGRLEEESKSGPQSDLIDVRADAADAHRSMVRPPNKSPVLNFHSILDTSPSPYNSNRTSPAMPVQQDSLGSIHRCFTCLLLIPGDNLISIHCAVNFSRPRSCPMAASLFSAGTACSPPGLDSPRPAEDPPRLNCRSLTNSTNL